VNATGNAPHPRLVRLLGRIPPGVDERRVVAPGSDLGVGSDADSAAAVAAGRSILGEGPVIERLPNPPRHVPLLRGPEAD
jgi:hypothetical protein